MKKSKITNQEQEQITFDSFLEPQPAQNEDELLNDIEVLINKQKAMKKEEEVPKKRGKKASPKHVRVKVRLSEPTTALPSAIVSHKEEQAREQGMGNIKESEVNIAAPASQEASINITDAKQYLIPQEVKEEAQEAQKEEIQTEAQEEEQEAHEEEIQKEEVQTEAQEEVQTEKIQEEEASEHIKEQDDDEQERLLRKHRVAMFTKPDILLETPYTVNAGKRVHTRYRLEFGRPDASIPPEISASTGYYVSKLDETDEKLIKKKKRSIRQKNLAREVSSWIISIASAVIIAFLLYSFVFVFVKVDGPSMMDTLHDQNYLFVWRLGYHLGTPQRGDVVICHYPDKDGKYDDVNYVKRVIGLPGEQVSMKDGYVYVDGRVVDEPYLTPLRRGSYTMDPIVLGAGEYFVLGDNRINSADSRQVGPIKVDQIIGKAVQKLLPLNEFSTIK